MARIIILTSIWMLGPITQVMAHESSPLPYVPKEILVRFDANATEAERTQQLRACGAKVLRKIAPLDIWHCKLGSSIGVQDALAMLRASGLVVYAEPNARAFLVAMPNDPQFDQQWGLRNTGQAINDPWVNNGFGTPGADMSLPAAWDITTGSAGVTVAIIDDSFDITHPDLAPNIWTNSNEIPGNGIDDDGNGYIDDISGWDFADNDADTSNPAGLSYAHGTTVAGCIGAAGNNNLGITGVNWNVRLMGLRFGLDTASKLMAMAYALEMGAHIVNMSFIEISENQATIDALALLKQAGILVVAGSGNSHSNNDRAGLFPASSAATNVLSVTATGFDDRLTSWGHYGALSIDVAAPGSSIWTTVPVGRAVGHNAKAASYDWMLGTSYATAYVSGIAALIKAHHPTALDSEIKGRIMASVDPLVAQQGLLGTDGRVNAASALTVTPIAVPVVTNLRWVDPQGLSTLDPGETIMLFVTLENVWLPLTGIEATLSSQDTEVTVSTQTRMFPDLGTGQSGEQILPFVIELSANITGYRRVLLSLNITGTGGYSITRRFPLVMGTLYNGVTISETLQIDGQNDSEDFHIEVPNNATELVVQTTSNFDVNLIVRHGSPAYFLFMSAFPPNVIDPTTLVSYTPNQGDETVTIPNPSPGTYHITVVDAISVNSFFSTTPKPYTLTARFKSPTASPNIPTDKPPNENTQAANASGCQCQTGAPFVWVWLLMWAILRRRRWFCHKR